MRTNRDRQLIREMIEAWVIWRDARDWVRFRTIWHPEGRMMATWWQGPFEEFIAMNDDGFTRGVRILHLLGGSVIDIEGERAVAQTKMSINQRAILEGVECDVSCTGRFYDFFARRDGRWGLVLRQPIYERDRIDAVVPGEVPILDPAVLDRFPEGYRHLAYLQTKIGYDVKRDMPGLTGVEVDHLRGRGAQWLAGQLREPW